MTHPRRLWLFAGVALLLGALLVSDWLLPEPLPPPGLPTAISGPDSNPLAGRQRQDLAALFEHPLFDPARQSLLEPDPAPEGPDPAAAQASPALSEDPRLDGIVIGPSLSGAYLTLPGEPVAFFRVGESAAGWTLRTVSADGVTISGPEGDLHLSAPPMPPP